MTSKRSHLHCRWTTVSSRSLSFWHNQAVLLHNTLWISIAIHQASFQSNRIFACANDDGLALTPPLGWRSWNLYEGSIDQSKMTAIMHGMVRPHTRPDHTGQSVSLLDLGYRNVGLDDLWQDCHSTEAASGMHYHDEQGRPLVNQQRFPSLSDMTALAHSLNLTAGWYANNCACSDHCRNKNECNKQIKQDVHALFDYGFDSLKIDGCGNETDLVAWNRHIHEVAASMPNPRKILVENCHGADPKFKPDRNLPPALGCPYHYYRTSHDLRNNYGSIMSNLGSVMDYHERNESYPGCWAYPDMLMVGIGNGLTMTETRSHFAAWAISSSPLILSHDVNNATITDRIWDVISNREILAVNQAYEGDSGGVYQKSSENVKILGGGIWYDVPAYQYLSKPVGRHPSNQSFRNRTSVAVLLVNSGNSTRQMTATFRDIPYTYCKDWNSVQDKSPPARLGRSDKCHFHLRDLWKHKSLGIHEESWSVDVAPHDAEFILLEPVDGRGIGSLIDVSYLRANREASLSQLE